MNGNTAIIVALPREVAALVNGWERRDLSRSVRVWRRGNVVVACAGIGSARVALACDAAMTLGPVATLVSAGVAGACDPKLHAGDVVQGATVIDARTGERFEAANMGAAAIVTAAAIVSVKEKARLRETYGASAVDMEAATVFRIAQAHGLQCRAIKAISDEAEFAMEGLERFVTHDGQFRQSAFAAYAAIRPHMWGRVMALGRNTARAVRALTEALGAEID